MNDEQTVKRADAERVARGETGRAVVMIDWRVIEQLLRLPDGVEIAVVYNDSAWGAVGVHLIGDSLPRNGFGERPVVLPTRYRVERLATGEQAVTLIEVDMPAANKANEQA